MSDEAPLLPKTTSANRILLFEPLRIRQIIFPNRLAVSPMCEYSSEDGFANDWHLVHLGARAVGGAGLVFTEATAVEADGRITASDLGIYKDGHIPFLKRITTFIRTQGAVPGIQLAHAGRKASTAPPADGGRAIPPGQPGGWLPQAPSAIPFHTGDPTPKEMSASDIGRVVEAFGRATERSLEAGFDVIEIHAAHGYLIHEFLSPLSNSRTDRYGGSFDNRIRILVEVVETVRTKLGPDKPLFVRISSTDWTEGGWTGDDSVELARRVKAAGVDLVDASSGGNVARATIPVKPGYQVGFAARIRAEAGIATGAVGLITSAEQAEKILQNGEADIILMAREQLRDPYFPMHAAQKLGVPIHAPRQYLRAFEGSQSREAR